MRVKDEFVIMFEELDRKIQKDEPLTDEERKILSAVISNQINVQYGYADIVSHKDGAIYEFYHEITYQHK